MITSHDCLSEPIRAASVLRAFIAPISGSPVRSMMRLTRPLYDKRR